ncbi:CCR4-NOT core subunit cdc39, partial [Coemansia sp. IMI 209127]
MSIMGVLSELYVTANLKLNLAFEIEVLCKALNLDVKEIQPSSILASKAANASVDKLATDLSRASIVGGVASSGVNPGQVAAQRGDSSGTPLSSGAIQMLALSGADISVDVLGVLTQHASFQAAEQLFTQQPTMKRLFYMLTERMIREIIPIHVARSVYVAVSCTRDTIQKDFCGEPNEENMHRAAQVMARGLAGALAVSLCREQLKSKLYLTMREFLIGHSIPEQSANSIAVGLVADNLDLACAIAEKESIERASVQIDSILSESYLARKRTRERSGQPFYDISRYNQLAYPPDFPDVLKVRLSSLQPGHLRVYEDYTQIPHFFSQISSGSQGLPSSTVATSGAEFNAVSSTSDLGITPAELGSAAADDANKFTTAQCFERFAVIIAELDKIVSNAAPNVSLSQLPSQHEACLFARDIIILAVRSANPDETAMDFAQALVNYLYRSESLLAIDLYVLLLARMCEMSVRVAKEVTNWLAFADDERKYNVEVTVALINEGLVSVEDQDTQLARLVDAGRPTAVDFAASLLRKTIVDKSAATSIRSFSKAIQALVKLAQNGRAAQSVTQLLEDIQQQQQQQQQAQTQQAQTQQQETQQQQQQQQEEDREEQENTALAIGPSPTKRSASASMTPEQEKRTQETASYQHILLNWARVYNHPAAGEAELTTLVRQLLQQVPLHDTNIAAAFFRACVEAAITFYEQSIRTARASGHQMADALVKLVVYLVKLGGGDAKTSLQPLRMFLSSVALEIVQTHTASPEVFCLHQRPYFRLLCSVLYEFNDAYRAKEPWCSDECMDEVVAVLGETLDLLNPTFVPGFSFVWLMLVAHRYFFPRLMEKKARWPLAASLLEYQIKFIEPFIADGQITESLKLLYRGIVCVILVILHDFPEFLANYALRLCDSIPASCVQLRNLLLSAYPREMRLPEPLTPNLKIDLLPEVSRSPEIPFDYAAVLEPEYLKVDLEIFLSSSGPDGFAGLALQQLLAKSTQEDDTDSGAATTATERYDVAKINAFVLHIVVTITGMAESSARDSAQRDALDLLKTMLVEADPEGRYLIVNAIANQLRFPSSHTYLCSRMILALFSKSEENVRECIGRVLVERILVNRPFPWGLLVTLIEILRNPYYAFWNHEFTRRSPQIVEILSAVAK